MFMFIVVKGYGGEVVGELCVVYIEWSRGEIICYLR